MTTPIKFQIRTLIVNSAIESAKKNIIESYIEKLNDGMLGQLVVVFKKYPNSIELYADYLNELKSHSEPLSPEKMEELFLSFLSKLE